MQPRTTVLVAAGDPLAAQDIKARLEKQGYAARGPCVSGAEALAAIERQRPDLMLVDVQLNGTMDGVELAGLVAARHKVPVVLMTARTDPATIERIKLANPAGFLARPFPDSQLALTLAIAHKAHESHHGADRREAWHRAMIGGLPMAVVATDATGAVRYMNVGAERLTGLAAAGAIGHPLAKVLQLLAPVDDRPLPDPVLTALADRRPPPRSRARLLRPDDEPLDVLVECGLIRPGGAEIAGATITLTPAPPLAASGFRTESRTGPGQDSAGLLAAGMARQLNNALQIMIGHAELISEGLTGGKSRRLSADTIRRIGKKTSELVEKLIAFTQKGSGRAQFLELAEVVGGVLAAMHDTMPSGIQLRNLASGSVQVRAMPEELELLIFHLVANAREAMPSGGVLTVETRPVDLDRTGPYGVESDARAAMALLSVSDTGIGMDPEVRAHLFEPFFTTRENRGGLGLGLASVFEIVHRSGGFIEVQTELSRGSTFQIYLPRVTASAATRAAAATADPRRRSADRRVPPSTPAGAPAAAAAGTPAGMSPGSDPGRGPGSSTTLASAATTARSASLAAGPASSAPSASSAASPAPSASPATSPVPSSPSASLAASPAPSASPAVPPSGRASQAAPETPPAPAPRSAPREPERTPRGMETILVVEDEEDVLFLVATELESLGYRVLQALSGPEALTRASQFPDQIDLLLTDIMMPGMSGFELGRRLQDSIAGLRVVYMTGDMSGQMVEHTSVDPGSGFLRKPFQMASLGHKIRETLEG